MKRVFESVVYVDGREKPGVIVFFGLDSPGCWLFGLVCSEGRVGLTSGQRGSSPLKGGHVGNPRG